MNTRLTTHRRRAPRAGAGRRAQGGAAMRGVIVAAGLVAAVVLQLAGPRLQCRLADLVGMPMAARTIAPAPAPAASCGAPSGVNAMHPCKVTIASADKAPVI